MHYFLYTSKDTFISNHENDVNKNYGSDESLSIYSSKFYGTVTASYSITYHPSGSIYGEVEGYTGYFNGALCGYDTNISGSIISGC